MDRAESVNGWGRECVCVGGGMQVGRGGARIVNSVVAVQNICQH